MLNTEGEIISSAILYASAVLCMLPVPLRGSMSPKAPQKHETNVKTSLNYTITYNIWYAWPCTKWIKSNKGLNSETKLFHDSNFRRYSSKKAECQIWFQKTFNGFWENLSPLLIPCTKLKKIKKGRNSEKYCSKILILELHQDIHTIKLHAKFGLDIFNSFWENLSALVIPCTKSKKIKQGP